MIRQRLPSISAAAVLACLSAHGQVPGAQEKASAFQGFVAVSPNQAWVWSNRQLWLLDAVRDSWKTVQPPPGFGIGSGSAAAAWFESDRQGIVIWISNASCDQEGCQTVLKSAVTQTEGKTWFASQYTLPDNPPFVCLASYVEQVGVRQLDNLSDALARLRSRLGPPLSKASIKFLSKCVHWSDSVTSKFYRVEQRASADAMGCATQS
jgi:hypothetical protein